MSPSTNKISVNGFEIKREGDNYTLLYQQKELYRSSRLTELVTFDSELLGYVNAVDAAREKVLDLFLGDERLFEKLVEFFDKEIAQDYEARKHVILTLFSTFMEKPLNLAVKAPSSEGKSHNVTTIARYFPSKNIIKLGDVSPTSLVHDTSAPLVDEDLNPIDDKIESINLDIKEASNEEKKELNQQKKELLKNAKYLIDLSDKSLIFLEEPSVEFWKKLRSVLSHDEKEIEYRITDKGKAGFQTKKAVVKGFPSAIYCTTRVEDLAIEDELKTRFISVTTESEPQKYKKALNIIAESQQFGDLADNKKEEPLIRELIRRILDNFDVNVLIPCFNQALSIYFSNVYSGVILRQSKEIGQLIKIHALIHHDSRPKLKVNGKQYVLATINDYKTIFNLFREQEDFFVEPHIKNFYHKIEGLLEESDGIRIEGILDFLKSQGKYYSSGYIYRNLEALKHAGYIAKDKDPDDRRKNVYQKISGCKSRKTKESYTRLDFNEYYLQLKKKLTSTSIEIRDPQGIKEIIQVDSDDVSSTLKNIFFRKRFTTNYNGNKDEKSNEKPDIKYSQFFSGKSPVLRERSIEEFLAGEKDGDQLIPEIGLENLDLIKKLVKTRYQVNKSTENDYSQIKGQGEEVEKICLGGGGRRLDKGCQYVWVRVAKVPPHPPEVEGFEIQGLDDRVYKIEEENQELTLPYGNARRLIEEGYLMKIGVVGVNNHF